MGPTWVLPQDRGTFWGTLGHRCVPLGPFFGHFGLSYDQLGANLALRWPFSHSSSPKIVQRPPQGPPGPRNFVVFPNENLLQEQFTILQSNSPKHAPRRPPGAQVGPSWGYLGPKLVPAGRHLGPSWRLLMPFVPPKSPERTPESAKARQKFPNVAQVPP